MKTKITDLLDAPCLFCGYKGPGYYQKETHLMTCPWYGIGGEAEREKWLLYYANSGLLKVVFPELDPEDIEAGPDGLNKNECPHWEPSCGECPAGGKENRCNANV